MRGDQEERLAVAPQGHGGAEAIAGLGEIAEPRHHAMKWKRSGSSGSSASALP